MTTPMAILRVEKMKASAVHMHAAHVLRTIPTRHADPTITPHNILTGDTSPAVAVKKYLAQHNIKPRNRETVVAVELLLSASPEFFAKKGKRFDREKTDAWYKKSMEWAKKEYGEKLVFSTLHLDELTPHIHLTVVPDDGGKLNAKRLFDRTCLRRLQAEYPAAVSSLGLARGEQGSTATHRSVRSWYGELKRFEQNLGESPEPPKSAFKRVADAVFDRQGEEMAAERKKAAAAEYTAKRQATKIHRLERQLAAMEKRAVTAEQAAADARSEMDDPLVRKAVLEARQTKADKEHAERLRRDADAQRTRRDIENKLFNPRSGPGMG